MPEPAVTKSNSLQDTMYNGGNIKVRRKRTAGEAYAPKVTKAQKQVLKEGLDIFAFAMGNLFTDRQEWKKGFKKDAWGEYDWGTGQIKLNPSLDIPAMIEVKKQELADGFKVQVKEENIKFHTVIHENAHSAWTHWDKSEKAKKFGKIVDSVVSDFTKDNGFKSLEEAYLDLRSVPKLKKIGWGRYAMKNQDEFFAEAMTKHILGEPDKYTRALYQGLVDTGIIKQKNPYYER